MAQPEPQAPEPAPRPVVPHAFNPGLMYRPPHDDELFAREYLVERELQHRTTYRRAALTPEAVDVELLDRQVHDTAMQNVINERMYAEALMFERLVENAIREGRPYHTGAQLDAAAAAFLSAPAGNDGAMEHRWFLGLPPRTEAPLGNTWRTLGEERLMELWRRVSRPGAGLPRPHERRLLEQILNDPGRSMERTRTSWRRRDGHAADRMRSLPRGREADRTVPNQRPHQTRRSPGRTYVSRAQRMQELANTGLMDPGVRERWQEMQFLVDASSSSRSRHATHGSSRSRQASARRQATPGPHTQRHEGRRRSRRPVPAP